MLKRFFDLFLSVLGLIFLGGILLICIAIATIDTKSFGVFIQTRIGQHGIPFKIFKIKTFSDKSKKVTAFGRFFRATKLDEIPQLLNVLFGTMSFVGPRPDIAGYADKLQANDRVILSLKPGITGLASLKYRNEEALLQKQKLPLIFNDQVIWPDKVRINKWYAHNHNFFMDLQILFFTIFPAAVDVEDFMNHKNKG